MNSAYGEIGKTVGSLIFEDSAGDTETIDLEEGINIRDHWTAYNNVAPHIYGTATYQGGVRFDAYEYLLSRVRQIRSIDHAILCQPP